MKNPITPSGLFHTPETIEEMQAYVERFSGEEKVLAYTIMSMTWNLAAKIVAESQAEFNLEQNSKNG